MKKKEKQNREEKWRMCDNVYYYVMGILFNLKNN